MSYEDYLIREMTVGDTTREEAQMNEEDAKLAADTVIEWLRDHRYITEDQYGKFPATMTEDIATVIVDVMNQ